MSLASDKPKLKDDLKAAINKASKDARLQADKIPVSEDMTAADISSKVADMFSDVFAKSLSADMADILESYIKGAKVKFTLTAPNGSVKGEIELT